MAHSHTAHSTRHTAHGTRHGGPGGEEEEAKHRTEWIEWVQPAACTHRVTQSRHPPTHTDTHKRANTHTLNSGTDEDEERPIINKHSQQLAFQYLAIFLGHQSINQSRAGRHNNTAHLPPRAVFKVNS